MAMEGVKEANTEGGGGEENSKRSLLTRRRPGEDA
jgi:hypothetical protein